MACDNQVGVRNILITFYDCDNDVTYTNIAHDLSGDEIPNLRLCDYANEPLPGGFVRRIRGNNEISMTIIRNPAIPLALYQGCAAIDVSIEYFDGKVITGLNGTPTGEDPSDGHEVTVSATFEIIDELLVATLDEAA